MKKHILYIIYISLTYISYGQNKAVDWKNVQIIEFTKREIPDSLSICGGEWFVEAQANNMSELDSQEIERIKKKVAEYGCDIVFIDLKNVFTPRAGQLYILGLKRKSEE